MDPKDIFDGLTEAQQRCVRAVIDAEDPHAFSGAEITDLRDRVTGTITFEQYQARCRARLRVRAREASLR